MPEQPVKDLQTWFQLEIVRPFEPTAEAALTGDANYTGVDGMILPNTRMQPAERMLIYSRSYYARLHGVLYEDFRSTYKLLGDEPFHTLVKAYLCKHPASSWTLSKLGAHFPAFLRDCDLDLPNKPIAADCAALERAMDEVTHADQPRAVLDLDALQNVPAEKWATAQFKPIPAFQLLDHAYETNAIVTALRKDQPLPDLAPKSTHTAVYRKPDFVVWRLTLAPAEAALLRALRVGATLGDALEAAAAVWAGDGTALQTEIFSAFRTWIGEGLFEGVTFAE